MKLFLFPFALSICVCVTSAAPVANWKELNPNELVVPITGADTDSPTFGDGVTPNSSQMAWIGARFGTVGAPDSVTLAAGETLTVSGSVVLTGGSNNSNQFRFGVFDDAGQFVLDNASGWTGGWLHSSGVAASSDLYRGRTDGPFISTAGDASATGAIRIRSGFFDGDSVAPFAFSMSITRVSDTTIDVISLFTGGDGEFSEEYVLEGAETTLFTYTAHGWLFGGSSGVEQVTFSEVQYAVTGGGDAEIVAIRSDGSTVEIDYEGAEGKTYFLESSLDMDEWDAELEDSLSGEGTFVDDLEARFPGQIPGRVFYRLRESSE